MCKFHWGFRLGERGKGYAQLLDPKFAVNSYLQQPRRPSALWRRLIGRLTPPLVRRRPAATGGQGALQPHLTPTTSLETRLANLCITMKNNAPLFDA